MSLEDRGKELERQIISEMRADAIVCVCVVYVCSQLNGTDFPFRTAGVLILLVDACTVPFRLTEKKVFSLADVSNMEEYLKTGIHPR